MSHSETVATPNPETATVSAEPTTPSSPTEFSVQDPEDLCRSNPKAGSRTDQESKMRFLELLRTEAGDRLKSRTTTFADSIDHPVDPLSHQSASHCALPPSLTRDVRESRLALGVLGLTAKPRSDTKPTDASDTHVSITHAAYPPVVNLAFPRPTSLSPEEKSAASARFLKRWEAQGEAPDWETLKQNAPDQNPLTLKILWTHRYLPSLERTLAPALEETKVAAENDYVKIVSRNPFIAYLKSACPTEDEVKQAKRDYIAAMNASLNEIRATPLGSHKAKLLIHIKPSTRRVLANHPDLCGAYRALARELADEETLRRRVPATMGLASVGGCLLTGPWFLACATVAGAATATVFAVNSAQDYMDSKSTTGSAILGDRLDPDGSQINRHYRANAVSEAAGAVLTGAMAIPAAAGVLAPTRAMPALRAGTPGPAIGQAAARGGATARLAGSSGEAANEATPSVHQASGTVRPANPSTARPRATIQRERPGNFDDLVEGTDTARSPIEGVDPPEFNVPRPPGLPEGVREPAPNLSTVASNVLGEPGQTYTGYRPLGGRTFPAPRGEPDSAPVIVGHQELLDLLELARKGKNASLSTAKGSHAREINSVLGRLENQPEAVGRIETALKGELVDGDIWSKGLPSVKSGPASSLGEDLAFLDKADHVARAASSGAKSSGRWNVVPGKDGMPRVANLQDFKVASNTMQRNAQTGEISFADKPNFVNVLSPRKVNGQWSQEPVTLNGKDVRVLVDGHYIDGKYISTLGPSLPRGANWAVLGITRQRQAWTHAIKVGREVILVRSQGSKIFVQAP